MSLDYEIERYVYICLKGCFGGIVICILKVFQPKETYK